MRVRREPENGTVRPLQAAGSSATTTGKRSQASYRRMKCRNNSLLQINTFSILRYVHTIVAFAHKVVI